MAESNVKSRVSYFYFCGLLFCFFLFPVFLINSSLASLLNLRLENHRQSVFSELSRSLQRLVPYNDERKYFHLMFRKMFNLASQSKSYKAYLEQALPVLKKNYPGCFEFVVWDKSGKVIEHLTDEKKYRFVMRKLWEAFNIVKERVQNDSSVKIAGIDEIKSTLNLARHFLGRVFIPETLKIPYSDEDEASVILADYGENRPYFWYQTGEKGGILCFISWEAIKGDQGLRNIVDSINQNSEDIIIGFASLHDLANPYLKEMQSIKSEVIMALARYEQSSEEYIDSKSAQIVVNTLNPHTRIFAARIKKDDIYYPDKIRIKTVLQIAVLFLIFWLIVHLQLNIRKVFFSIRWKLLVLFLFANLVPLLILGTIAYDYLQNKYLAISNDVFLNSARMLRDLDNRYTEQSESFTEGLNNVFKRFNENLSSSDVSESKFKALVASLREFFPSEILIVDRDGSVPVAINDVGKNISNSVSYVKSIANAILKFHNGIITPYDKSNLLSKAESPEESDFIRNSIQNGRRLNSFNVGETEKLSYWDLIGDRENYDNRYFVMLLWDLEKFQGNYLKNHLQKLLNSENSARAFASVKGNRNIYPAKSDVQDLEWLLKEAARTGNATTGRLKHHEEWYLYTAIPGKNMNKTSFVAIFPEKELKTQINQLRNRIIAGGFFSILLTIVVSLAFARQFLQPVKQLGDAAGAVAQHDFRHRLTIKDEDEFGHLSQVMNRMIEGLGELEIARVVQESLLPEVMPDVSPFSVYGQSHVMTALGGDYFDFVEIDSEHFGVIIGDVSGHGISAALIMAMAKAGVKLAGQTSLLDPAALLMEIHKIIFSIKNKKLRRMMTLQYLIINKVTGVVQYANAGHCYPLLLNVELSNGHYIEQNSLPLGISKRPSYCTRAFTIGEGESLILYTDGIPESQNAQGEMLGYDGMASMVMRSSAIEAKEFYSNIVRNYIDYAGSVNDDMTIIVLKRKAEANG